MGNKGNMAMFLNFSINPVILLFTSFKQGWIKKDKVYDL